MSSCFQNQGVESTCLSSQNVILLRLLVWTMRMQGVENDHKTNVCLDKFERAHSLWQRLPSDLERFSGILGFESSVVETSEIVSNSYE